jgi:ribosomal protein S14
MPECSVSLTANPISVRERRAGQKGGTPRPCCDELMLCRQSKRKGIQETMPAAINPGFTDLDAVLNSSACFVEKRVFLR